MSTGSTTPGRRGGVRWRRAKTGCPRPPRSSSSTSTRPTPTSIRTRVIDAPGFQSRPRDPLGVAWFALALPSPAFLAGGRQVPPSAYLDASDGESGNPRPILLPAFRQRGEHFLAVFGGTDAGPDLGDLARRVDQEGIARSHAAGAQRPVLVHHFLIRIGEQLERQALFGAELLVAIGGIHADADDDGVLLLVLRQVLLKVVRFNGAALRHVFRVEVQHHPLSTKLLQADLATLLGRQRELGRRLSDLRHVGRARGGKW